VKFGIAISDQPFVSEVDLSQGTGQRLDLEIEIFNELIKARSKTEDPLGPLRDRIKVRDEKIADIFQKLDNARFFDPGEEELYLDVVRKLNLFPGQRYLHVGISLYKIVIILSLLGVKCTFVDMEPCVIRVVKVWMKMIKNIKEVENSQIEFVNTNIDSFNGEDGYFDVITMFHVFYNFQGDEMIAMGNLLRMAKNKGRIWLQQETMMGGNIENIFANTAIQQGISIRKIVNSEIEDKGYRDITPNYGYRVNKNGIEVPFSDLLGKDLKEPRSLADCSA
jgi:2-polyprenyl-3-methyl-5-hydroxy-6-metoxy-1,4-benzoquinol methylase